ncbi:SDR family NAD(P)-dependent oxidoreductase [Thalassobaculum salexigens]|uniref:SDR family NAD(P)-dependent oxidoreductase n=1 Tax=Thalassobaculum salexigens TaxID=455360 RepID=UPI00248E2D3A|nr:SDR family oxidoreductase [Thalassobaculum salexigens]
MSRISVITGGASGIGRACADVLAERGDTLVIADMNAEGAAKAAEDLKSSGAVAHALALDVADDAAVEDFFDRVESEIGAVGAVVHSAGILQNAMTTERMNREEADRIMDVNYRGTWSVNVAACRRMKARQAGAVVNLASINSFTALPIPSYNVSKVAVKALTEILAVEYGIHGIRVNAVAPTYTITPAIQARIDSGHRDPEAIRDAGALKILVTPRNIAEPIAFLLSDAAAAITGVTLPVDAGYAPNTTYRSYVAPVEGFGQ